MSQIIGLSSIQGLSSWANQGAAPDVTPNAVNWTNVSAVSPASTITQTITGIDTNINLEISWTTLGTGTFIVYYGASSQTLSTSPTTITVSNNTNIYFTLFGSCPTRNVTVKNASDGNVVLDTFTIQADGGGCG